MKAVNIQWNTEKNDIDIKSLPTEIKIPDKVFRKNFNHSSTRDLYNDKVVAICEYIYELTDCNYDGFSIEVERKDAIQYCLDKGEGIVHVDDDYDAETTQKELAKGDKARYVLSDYVDFYVQQDKCIIYAVISEMNTFDFYEWQSINEILDIDLSWEDAIEINTILRSGYCFSPMLDIEKAENPKSIKDALQLSELTYVDEKQIYDIIQKYGSPLEMSSSSKDNIDVEYFGLEKQKNGDFCLVNRQGIYLSGLESYKVFEEEKAEREQEEHDWEDYGDIQIRSTHKEGVYEVVLVVSDENDESKAYAGYTTLDVKYYKNEEYVVNQAAKIYGKNFTDEELIVEIIHNEGYEKALMELDMNAFNEKGEYAKLSTSLKAYSINKSELGDKLMDLGIPIDEERIQELGKHNKSSKNKKTKQKQNEISLD